MKPKKKSVPAKRVRRRLTLEAHEWDWLDAYAQRDGISQRDTIAAAMAALARAETSRPVKTAADLRREATELSPQSRPKVNLTAALKRLR